MIKIIGFDLDNTLYYHQQYIKFAYHEISKFVSEKHGIIENEYHKWIFSRWMEKGSSYNRIFEESYIYFGLPNFMEDINNILYIYHHAEPELTLYKGIKKLLDKLIENYKLVLITDGKERTQNYKIDKLMIREYFKLIYISDKYGRDYYKPSSKMFEKCLFENKIKAEQMIYIGDNPVLDYPPCSKLGINFIRLKAGEYMDIKIDEKVKDIELKNINYLLKMVGDINEEDIGNNNN